ncbi:hypothetical protein KKH23_07665 [Patescibacteria group bacterium]|uniref:Putative structural protein n=1 Tax=viral metagenome TaxID=1070528 RepID=A0A6M3X872_9ZZZZ|nr:hypothetical protein [Patescibacteria group bacterium]
MGRYYNGDIKGKFWFEVQSSDDADFFGVRGTEPSILDYYFDEDDLPKVKEGIEKCEQVLGSFKERLDNFFEDKNGYNNEMIEDELKIGSEKVKELLEWYARLNLGEKIAKCIEENGQCAFGAEL